MPKRIWKNSFLFNLRKQYNDHKTKWHQGDIQDQHLFEKVQVGVLNAYLLRGFEKGNLCQLDFVEQIEAFCKLMKMDDNDDCMEMHLDLRGNIFVWCRMLKLSGINVNNWKEA